MKKRPDLLRWLALSVTLSGATFGLFILGLLVAQSLPILRFSGVDYFTGGVWHYRAEIFGVLPMVYGTLVVSAIALVVATPIAIGAALFVAEVVPSRLRMWIKVPIELLAGVPSVVYGLLGVLLLRNWVYKLLQPFDLVETACCNEIFSNPQCCEAAEYLQKAGIR